MWSLFVTAAIGGVLVGVGLMQQEARPRWICIGLGGFLVIASLMSCAKQLHDPDSVVVIELFPAP
jgi:hypothetical protein